MSGGAVVELVRNTSIYSHPDLKFVRKKKAWTWAEDRPEHGLVQTEHELNIHREEKKSLLSNTIEKQEGMINRVPMQLRSVH